MEKLKQLVLPFGLIIGAALAIVLAVLLAKPPVVNVSVQSPDVNVGASGNITTSLSRSMVTTTGTIYSVQVNTASTLLNGQVLFKPDDAINAEEWLGDSYKIGCATSTNGYATSTPTQPFWYLSYNTSSDFQIINTSTAFSSANLDSGSASTTRKATNVNIAAGEYLLCIEQQHAGQAKAGKATASSTGAISFTLLAQ